MKPSTSRLLPAPLLALALLLGPQHAGLAATDLSLPDLGESGGQLFSSEHEYQLGRAWLRMFRAQVPTESDPVLQDYLDQLLFDLATHSQLGDRRLEPVLVKNQTLNAFAVPGGVVGVHTGLLLYAESEEEMAAVLAHELAHLSQRHFSRGVEDARSRTVPTLAGLLTGLVLAAAGSGDAGMAAIMATQAGAMESQLRFSRENEQEADRVGIQTMVSAGLDPRAMPGMFERMERSSRFQGNRIPEFLLTHPVTESRISDSRNRAEQQPGAKPVPPRRFEMMKARVLVSFSDTPAATAQRFRAALEAGTGDAVANRYGLALAQLEAGQTEAARKQLSALLADAPSSIPLAHALAQLEIRSGNYGVAARLLEKHLGLNPRNHALSLLYAEALRKTGNARKAEQVLNEQVRLRPSDPHIWYQVAETRGMAGNIIGVHEARAEYFILNGMYDKAEQQLGYALKLVQGDFNSSARIQSRLDDIAEMRSFRL